MWVEPRNLHLMSTVGVDRSGLRLALEEALLKEAGVRDNLSSEEVQDLVGVDRNVCVAIWQIL